jgi:hypothetical protein
MLALVPSFIRTCSIPACSSEQLPLAKPLSLLFFFLKRPGFCSVGLPWAVVARASWRRKNIASAGIKRGGNSDLHDEDTERLGKRPVAITSKRGFSFQLRAEELDVTSLALKPYASCSYKPMLLEAECKENHSMFFNFFGMLELRVVPYFYGSRGARRLET